jgi:hypothetical protein
VLVVLACIVLATILMVRERKADPARSYSDLLTNAPPDGNRNDGEEEGANSSEEGRLAPVLF